MSWHMENWSNKQINRHRFSMATFCNSSTHFYRIVLKLLLERSLQTISYIIIYFDRAENQCISYQIFRKKYSFKQTMFIFPVAILATSSQSECEEVKLIIKHIDNYNCVQSMSSSQFNICSINPFIIITIK